MELTIPSSLAAARPNAPSGIAQLRQSSAASAASAASTAASQSPVSLDVEAAASAMNLDDFLVPSSIGTPAGVSSPAGSGLEVEVLAAPRPPYINDEDALSLARASAPSAAVSAMAARREFDYVQRRVRKTSIDERRVSVLLRFGRCLFSF